MYGHGAAPPPTRTSGTVITLRVLFALAGFFSCGLLACLPLFRIAVLRGKWYDWLLAWFSLPAVIGGLGVVGSVPESDHRSDVAMAFVLLVGAASGAYFVIFDIRHHRALPPAGPVPHTGAYLPPQAPQQGYAYPPAQPYAGQTPPPYTPTPAPTPTPTPTPPPPPQRPAPARIDQVRAELDEISDYLRKHEDGR